MTVSVKRVIVEKMSDTGNSENETCENEVTMKGTTHDLHVTNSTRSIKLPS